MMPCHYHNGLFPLALAIVCTAGTLQIANPVSAADIPPLTIEMKQAKKLAIVHEGPEYPAVARINYVDGVVRVELTIDDKGKVNRTHVVEGNAVLAESALKAARGWIYRPLVTPSGPSGFVTVVAFHFSVSDRPGELTSQRAVKDFLRGVKPPQALHPPADTHSGGIVHIRLLLDEKGQVIDGLTAPSSAGELDIAFEELRHWTFRPAHWGNIPVALYLDVDVPLGEPSATRTAANSESR